MCGSFKIHSGMGIFQRVASYELREEEQKVVTVEEGEGGIYPFRVRAALTPKFSYAGGYSRCYP